MEDEVIKMGNDMQRRISKCCSIKWFPIFQVNFTNSNYVNYSF